MRPDTTLQFRTNTYKQDLLEYTGKTYDEWYIEREKWEALGGVDVVSVEEPVRQTDYNWTGITHEQLIDAYNHPSWMAYGYTGNFVRTEIPKEEGLQDESKQFAKEFLGNKTKNALEHGCGGGLSGFHLWQMGYSITLCDLPLNWFKFMEWRTKKYHVPDIDFIFINHPYEYLPEGRMWDFMWSHHVLEHCKHPHKALGHLSDHLKIGCFFYLQPAFTGDKYHLVHNCDLFGIEENGIANDHGNHVWRKCIKDAGLEQYKYKNCVDLYQKVRQADWNKLDFK